MSTIDACLLQKAFLAGAKGLEAKKEWINELNVFPVPDGDTGTNMTMTIMAAAKEVAAIEEPTLENLSKAISSGSLRGARGNSGVILSQLLRGFTKEMKQADFITVPVLARAFAQGTETAYKAVMKPKEGTILTVAKGMAEKAEQLKATEDILVFLEQVIAWGDEVLSQTPDMLPVLKQAGVVDSGGQGLMELMKGVLDGLTGKVLDLSLEMAHPSSVSAGIPPIQTLDEDIRYGYCTEFIINTEPGIGETEERELKTYLETVGDSLVVVADEDVVKIHVHTNDPGLAIQKALTYGSLSRIKIDNMREEHEERLIKAAQYTVPQAERKPYGFLAVSIGDGLGEVFRGIGVDYLIEGGQTMNPSTEDLLNAVEQVAADTIFILPNNKNIILAAEQAKSLVSEKEVIVVPSKTVPQGICAMINFIPDLPAQKNLETMIAEMERVKTGQITYAVRDTILDDKEIHEGDIMGIGDQGILTVGTDLETTAVETVEAMVDQDSELVTIYYGCDVTKEEAFAVMEKAQTVCPDCEMELHAGGQPIYYYLISVE